MKKIIFTSLIAIISLSTFAQGNSQKNKSKNHNSVSKKDKDRDEDRYEDSDSKEKRENTGRNDDRYEDRDNRDRREGRNRNDDRNDNNRYSKNTPRKVSDAFRNDFPNATNVQWTKDRGTWTATFGGGILGNNRSATYRANGQRISTTGILGRRN